MIDLSHHPTTGPFFRTEDRYRIINSIDTVFIKIFHDSGVSDASIDQRDSGYFESVNIRTFFRKYLEFGKKQEPVKTLLEQEKKRYECVQDNVHNNMGRNGVSQPFLEVECPKRKTADPIPQEYHGDTGRGNDPSCCNNIA